LQKGVVVDAVKCRITAISQLNSSLFERHNRKINKSEKQAKQRRRKTRNSSVDEIGERYALIPITA